MESSLKPVLFVLTSTFTEEEIDKFLTALKQIRMGQIVSTEFLPFFEKMESELSS